MKVVSTSLPGVVLLEPARYDDERGFFMETFREGRYHEAGLGLRFVQDNLSHSTKHVLRGLHFQKRQAKLVTVVRGEIFDVAVDVRPDSENFRRWVGGRLSADNHRQLYLPPGFAHGFCVLSDEADVWYKTTDVYRPEEESGILWNDPKLGITWPVAEPVLSRRDQANPRLDELSSDRLVTSRELETPSGIGER